MIGRILTAIFFVLVCVGIVLLARGYRIDVQKSTITSTGLVAVTSTPRLAKVYVNSEPKGITDLSLNLEPGTYTFTVFKEGYFPWQKTITIKGEIVQGLDAILYPVNSSLTPLTNIGIVRAIPIGSLQSQQYILLSDKKIQHEVPVDPVAMPSSSGTPNIGGIYLYDTTRRVVSLLPNLQRIVDYDKLEPDMDPHALQVLFSPNSKQLVLFDTTTSKSITTNSIQRMNAYDPIYVPPADFRKAYLINIDDSDATPLDITDTVNSLLSVWTETKAQQLQALTATLPKVLDSFILDHTRIVDMSVDKYKILYEATAAATLAQVKKETLIGSNQTPETRTITKHAFYVYDIKEDRNYLLKTAVEAQDKSDLQFHPNSKNILFEDDKSISISDFDGTNSHVIYSGPLISGFMGITDDGRLLVLTNLNPQLNTAADLYAVGIR